MKVEKNFVIERADIDKVHTIFSAYYGDRVTFTTQNSSYDFNISFTEEGGFINLLENRYWETDYSEDVDFVRQVNETFSNPLYLFLDSNSAKRSDEFWSVRSGIRKIVFQEE